MEAFLCTIVQKMQKLCNKMPKMCKKMQKMCNKMPPKLANFFPAKKFIVTVFFMKKIFCEHYGHT
jgi:hypothetical protein